MIITLFAAAIAAATQPASGQSCALDPVEAVCRAVAAQGNNQPAAAAAAFEEAAAAIGDASLDAAVRKSRALAAAGNMWIAAGEPGKAALALDRALAGTGLRAEQRGEALLDRARAAEAQNDLRTARARVGEASALIAEDPFLWFFSAALAIREGNRETAQSAINKALSLAPGDATVLFEAGHVAHFRGEVERARDYWNQAASAGGQSAIGKAARKALALLPAPVTVKPETAKAE